MTATARKIDGLGRDRLLEFANGTDDDATREALIDLAGKWKHNWIPLDAIAAAIKAKRMKGDGIRRPSTPDVSASRPAGKTRFDPKGAAKHSALVSGSRSKGKIPAGAQARTEAAAASQHAASLSTATQEQMRAAARAHEAADRAHHAAGNPATAEHHRAEANRLHAAANAQRPPAADYAGPAGDANREAAIAGSEASTAARDARHAQIRKEIKVKKEIRNGRVHFVASHSNGTNTVSMAHPQAPGVTDAQHRKQVRDSLHRRIVSDQPGRRPNAGPDAGQPGGDPNVAKYHELRKVGLDHEQATAGVAKIAAAEPGGKAPTDAADAFRRNMAARAASSRQHAEAIGVRQPATEGPRGVKATHPVGAPVLASQPGIDRETRGHVTGHTDNGMVKVQHADRHGNQVIGTFNPHHTRVLTGQQAAEHDFQHGGPTAAPGLKPTGLGLNGKPTGENAPSVRGSTQADRDKAHRAQTEAQTAAAISTLGSRDMADLRRLAESKAVKPKVRKAALAELERRGVSEADRNMTVADLRAELTGDSTPGVDRTKGILNAASLTQFESYSTADVEKARDRAVALAADRSKPEQHRANAAQLAHYLDRMLEKRAGQGKAEAAAKPAAPEAPTKKVRKPSALHQEYRDRRAEQDRRFEAHTGGGVAAQDTHTQEYKDYFGVGDHSTSPQEQRLTFKSFLEERRQGAEYERRQQQGYDAGVKLGAAHGDFEGDTSSHDAEYQHAAAGHDEEMFGQGYSDGIQTGAARLEQRQKDNARKMAELEYGRTRDVAAGVSKAAVTEAGHRAAVHAHVAVAKAALAAGRRPEAQHHIAKAQEHKGHADRLAGEAQPVPSPPAGETRRLERNQSIVVGGPNAGQVREGTSTATAGSAVEKERGDTSRPDAAGITVEHSGDGTLVHGTERSDTETTAALKAQGFKWSRNLNAWYLPRTWGESIRETRVRGLEARLGDKITVQRGSVAKSTSGADERAARIARNAELEQKHTERAGKLDAEAQRRFDAADRATAGIPFGQPILLGHHSQRGHERALERSHANMGAGVQAHGEAERARDLATSAAARNRLEEDPKFLARRLDRNQAEHRKVLRTLERADPADEHTQRLEAIRKDLAGKIEADQAAMAAAGGGQQHSKATITAGDVITYRGSAHVVHRTNAKSVTVPHWDERLAAAGYTDTIPYSQITGHGRLETAKPETLRKMLERPGTPDAIKSRIRAILRDKGESTT